MKFFFDQVVRKILSVNKIRNFYCFCRVFYFCKILKRMKDFNDVSEDTWKHTLSSNKRVVYNKDIKLPKHPDAKRTFDIGMSLDGSKTRWLLQAVKAKHNKSDYKNLKILSIGPRSEGEIFFLYSNGFEFQNISAIDLFSYSPLIELCDMHNLKYDNSTFDIVLMGWCLAYSNNKKKVLLEVNRVLKKTSSVIIGHTMFVASEKEIISKRGYLVASPFNKIKDKNDLDLLMKESNFKEFYSNPIEYGSSKRIIYGATKQLIIKNDN